MMDDIRKELRLYGRWKRTKGCPNCKPGVFLCMSGVRLWGRYVSTPPHEREGSRRWRKAYQRHVYGNNQIPNFV